MKYCTHCGKEIKNGSKFCTSCGQEIKETKTRKNPKGMIGGVFALLIVFVVGLLGFNKIMKKDSDDVVVEYVEEAKAEEKETEIIPEKTEEVEKEEDVKEIQEEIQEESPEDVDSGNYIEIKEVSTKKEKTDIASTPSENFEFSEDTNGSRIITGYKGTDENIVISSTLYDGRLTIGKEAFAGNDTIRSVTVSNVIVDDRAFDGCPSLEEVTVVCDSDDFEYQTMLYSEVFANCSNLKSVHVKGSYCQSSSGAFANDNNLTEVEIGEDIRFIGAQMFKGCTALKSIKIPDKCTAIYSEAFADCTSLESVEWKPYIDTSIKYEDLGYGETYNQAFIGGKAFLNCSSLSSFDIPDRTDVCGGAFMGCTSLKEVIIPAGTCGCSNGIQAECFKDCSSLEKVIIYDEALNGEDDGYGYHEKTIGESAFEGCTSLEELEISEFFKYVKKHAFKNCSSLKKVVWNDRDDLDKEKFISDEVFIGCTNLTDVYLPALKKPVATSYTKDIFDRTSNVTIHTPHNSAMEEHAERFNFNFENDY